MRGIPAPETAANAIGRHKVMIAVEPATMVPTKKIKPKTKKLGMGSASNNPGKAVITLVCVKRSLKIITTKVLMTIRASNAGQKKQLDLLPSKTAGKEIHNDNSHRRYIHRHIQYDN